MRAKYHEGTNGPAVADKTEDAALDPDDPMNQCDTLDDAVTPEPKKRRGRAPKMAKEYTPGKVQRGKPLIVTMPARSPSAHPHNTATVDTTFVVTGKKGVGTLWIAEEHVIWLVEYLADEVATGGVALGDHHSTGKPAVAGEPAENQPLENCALPWLNIRAKPRGGAIDEYEAMFVEGPLKGTNITSRVSAMNQGKWDQCQATGQRWGCPGPQFEGATRPNVVRAVCHFLELHMAKKLLSHCGHDPTAVVDPIDECIQLKETQAAAS